MQNKNLKKQSENVNDFQRKTIFFGLQFTKLSNLVFFIIMFIGKNFTLILLAYKSDFFYGGIFLECVLMLHVSIVY